jgi:hypothetical protein
VGGSDVQAHHKHLRSQNTERNLLPGENINEHSQCHKYPPAYHLQGPVKAATGDGNGHWKNSGATEKIEVFSKNDFQAKRVAN